MISNLPILLLLPSEQQRGRFAASLLFRQGGTGLPEDGIEARRAFLAGHWFFQGCDRKALARLLPRLRQRDLAAGETLAAAGEVFFASSPCLLFFRDEKGPPVEVSVWGEEGLLGIGAVSGRVEAGSACRVFSLPVDLLAGMAESCPGLVQRAAQAFAARCAAGRVEARPEAGQGDGAAAGLREVCGWLGAMLAPALVLVLLRGDPVLAAGSRYFLAIFASVACMWVFRLLPDFIPVIFGLLAMIVFGVAPPRTVLSGFASDSFFMAMSVLGLGTVIRASGLGFRILLMMISLRPGSRWWHNFCVFAAGLLLTPVIPSANGRIAIISPFVQELLGAGGERKRAAARLTVSALAGASVFSAVFLSSKSINFIMFGYLPAQEQLRFQWTYWFVAASCAGLALLVMFIAAWSLVFRSEGPSRLSRDTVKAQLRLLGPPSGSERAAVAGVLAFAVSLATSSFHRIEIPWIAMSVLFGLLMFGFLDRDSFRRSIDWSFLFFLGGLVGMVRTMRAVGVDRWLSGKCAWLTAYMVHDLGLFVVVLAGVLFAVRLVLPINATAVIFLTLLMPAAHASGVNPWIIGFMVLFLAETWVFPYQASYYLQFCSITGCGSPADDRRLAPFNLSILAMKVAAIYLSLPWWRFLGLL